MRPRIEKYPRSLYNDNLSMARKEGPMSEPATFIPADTEVAGVNQTRWNALSRAGVEYARPYLELDRARCWTVLDREGLLDDPAGKRVLVLAGGGGQQSACLAYLGAQVTVLDLSQEQLARDREAAAAHGLRLTLEQGDMRDLGRFAPDSFDIVYHPHSINFVPDVRAVFAQVARVLRIGGQYKFDLHNPFTQLVDDDDFDPARGFSLRHPYRDGEVDLTKVFGTDQWVVTQEDGSTRSIDHPRSWVHTLGAVVNALARENFALQGMGEETSDARNPEGWERFKQITCPYLYFWTRLMPGLSPARRERGA